jgi:hypothetical protein
MNQASWRRILQRAGDELPVEGAAIINIQDRAPATRRGRQPQESHGGDSSDLDFELSRALDRAGRKNRGPYGMPPSAPLTARNPYVSMQPVPMPLPPQNVRKSGSGVRNIVAISLSVAVVGLAFHQISSQWADSRTGGAKPEDMRQLVNDPHLPSALFVGAGSTDTPNRPAEVAPRSNRTPSNRIDLLPSLAVEPTAPAPAAPAPAAAQAPSNDRQALYAEMEQAVNSYLEREGTKKPSNDGASTSAIPPQPKARVAANTPASSFTGTGSEQATLRRGRERMERGDVAGARLIFEHLATQNSALGAFALAQTYDSRYISQNSLVGATPDEERAARWYQRAVELGGGG